MALAKLAIINEYSGWAAWKIEESATSLISQCCLEERSLAEWHSISHPIKQLEWLSSRVALCSVQQAMHLPLLSTHKDSKGKPYVQNNVYCISLANSYPYGVAIVHLNHSVGIDIEQPSDKLRRIQHKFLSDVEINAVDDSPMYRCIYWCIKECLYKLYGRKQLSLKDNIIVHSVHADAIVKATASIHTNDRCVHYRLEGITIDSFFVVYSVT